MTISERDRRALMLLGAGLAAAALLYVVFPNGSGSASVAAPAVNTDSVGLAQQRLVRLRQIAGTLPGREAAFKQAAADLSDRERGTIQADTAPQAQAALLEIARRIGKNEDIVVLGGDFGAPKAFGDYGLVYTTVTFECHVEQLVNFLADLSRETEIVAPSEERISLGNPKEKTMGVRMVLAGLVAKKLVPEKKGLGRILKPKLIALNLLLVVALGAIVWQARIRWNEAQAKRESNLHVKVKPAPTPPVSPTPKPDGAQATKYADVATQDLFSKDRNPNVVIEPPKVEKPKVMPPLPVVYGVLGLPSGTKAIMAEKAGGNSRPVHAGDTIGEFTIASLDPQHVVFDWDGKQISKNIEDLMDRSSGAAPPGGVSGGGQAGNAAPPPPPRPSAPTAAAAPGQEIPTAPGQSQRSCVPGDTSPAGTMVDGYRKNVTATPFGSICSWTKTQ